MESSDDLSRHCSQTTRFRSGAQGGKSIRSNIPNLEFLVIGRGDDLERIKKLTEEMGLNDCVRFLGAMPTDQLSAYLRQADLGVVLILYDAFTRYFP